MKTVKKELRGDKIENLSSVQHVRKYRNSSETAMYKTLQDNEYTKFKKKRQMGTVTQA
jgi:hypothetical protein